MYSSGDGNGWHACAGIDREISRRKKNEMDNGLME